MTLSVLAKPTRTYAPSPLAREWRPSGMRMPPTPCPTDISHPPRHMRVHTLPYTHRMPATQRSHAGWRPTGKSARRRRQAGTQTCTTHTPGTLDAPGNAPAFNSTLRFGVDCPKIILADCPARETANWLARPAPPPVHDSDPVTRPRPAQIRAGVLRHRAARCDR